MSHDRGCYCGREKYEYDDCTRENCSRREKPLERKPEVSKAMSVKQPTANSYTLDGYVIVPPLNSWDEKQADKIIPEMSYNTFSTQASNAWALRCGILTTHEDFSKRVQAWHDRGYRLKRAKLTIDMGES